MKDTKLWRAIETLEIGSKNVEFSFAGRLARENRWTADFALRVIAEYRKFLYLSAVAGHSVTPSDEVDQAWHLHLCYTENYWNDCCDGVLGYPLHHGPTKGGKGEAGKFHEWYAETLKSYREHFGVEAPVDIWPTPSVRFATRSFRRVDASKNLIIPKRTAAVAAATTVGALLIAGCSSEDANRGVIGIFFIVALLFVVYKLIKYGGGGGGKGGCGASGWGGGGCGGSNGDGDSGCGSGCGGCGD